MKNYLIYVVCFVLGLLVSTFSCQRNNKPKETNIKNNTVLNQEEIDSIQNNLLDEISYLKKSKQVSRKEARKLKKQIKNLSKNNTVLISQNKRLKQINSTKPSTVIKEIVVDDELIKDTIYLDKIEYVKVKEESIKNKKDSICCKMAKSIFASNYTSIDTTYFENDNLFVISKTSTKGFPVLKQELEVDYTRFISLQNKTKAIYLTAGVAMPTEDNLLFPVGVTFNRDKWSYSFRVYTPTFQNVTGGEVSLGFRLFKW